MSSSCSYTSRKGLPSLSAPRRVRPSCLTRNEGAGWCLPWEGGVTSRGPSQPWGRQFISQVIPRGCSDAGGGKGTVTKGNLGSGPREDSQHPGRMGVRTVPALDHEIACKSWIKGAQMAFRESHTVLTSCSDTLWVMTRRGVTCSRQR